jgi:uncharacterized protein with HEPN domain
MTLSKCSRHASYLGRSIGAYSHRHRRDSNSACNKSLEDLKDDLFLRLAIERAFEIISEASRNIPGDVKAQQLQIDWLRLADFGNRLRHAYHRIDPNLLWLFAERDLPPLKAFVERVIRESQG